MKKYNRKIDVIIPAYNVPDHILFRCLASIACQDIASELEVTIVDDASTEQNYAKVAKNFDDILKINILRYEVNGGPGVARQYGMDHTSNGYITFIDADDTFNGAFVPLLVLRLPCRKVSDGLLPFSPFWFLCPVLPAHSGNFQYYTVLLGLPILHK